MSYWVADSECLQIWRKVKRLRDFKAEEGRKYLVRKNMKRIEDSELVPIYRCKNGRLSRWQHLFLEIEEG